MSTATKYPLPWTLEEDERYEGGAPVYIIKAANGAEVMSDQTYYPVAPTRPVAEAIMAAMNALFDARQL